MSKQWGIEKYRDSHPFAESFSLLGGRGMRKKKINSLTGMPFLSGSQALVSVCVATAFAERLRGCLRSRLWPDMAGHAVSETKKGTPEDVPFFVDIWSGR